MRSVNDSLKEALDQVRAEQPLKDDTLAFLRRRTGGFRRAPAAYVRPALSLAACLVLIACLGLWKVWFTPVSVISIDINPSLELSLNRFDRVLSVEGYNEDGQALADSLEVRFLDYQDALDAVLSSDMVAQCLARNEVLSIAVADDDARRQEELLTGVQSCTAGHGQAHCYAADSAGLEEAHHAGLSYGKYQAYLELSALDPDITPEDVRDMTMREIRQRIADLSAPAGEAPSSGTPGSSAQGPGADSSQGYGQGSGAGMGSGHHGEGGGHHYGRENGTD